MGLNGPLKLQLCEVAGELEADANIILHTANLPAECNPITLKGVKANLELIRVNLHLLAKAQEHPLAILGNKGRLHVDSPLLKHDNHQLAHGVLDGLGCEDTNPVRLLVEVKGDARNRLKCPLVVLGLESKVPLDEDEDGRRLLSRELAEHINVLPHHGKLLSRV